MNKAQTIAGAILGLLFITFGLNFFLHFIPMPSPPEGSPAANFMGAMYGTGFLTFVKVLEILGGVLTALPKTRTLGLIILTPIVVNILAFHVFITSGAGLLEPPVIIVTLLTLFLLKGQCEKIKTLICPQS